MPQVQATRLPRSTSNTSLRPAATTAQATTPTDPTATPASTSSRSLHTRKPSVPARTTRSNTGSTLKHKPLHRVSGSGSGSGSGPNTSTSTSSASVSPAKSGIPTAGLNRLRLRSAARPPTSSSASSAATASSSRDANPELRPVQSLAMLRQQPLTASKTGGERAKPTATPLTAARTGPASTVPKGFLSAVRSTRSRTMSQSAEMAEAANTKSPLAKAEVVPSKEEKAMVKRRPSVNRTSPILGGAKRVPAPTTREEDAQPRQPSPPPKPNTRSLIRRPLSLADRVFGPNSSLKIAPTSKQNGSPKPATQVSSSSSTRTSQARARRASEVESPTHARAERAVRASLTRRSSTTAPPTAPQPSSPHTKFPSPTGSRFSSPIAGKFPPSPTGRVTSPKSPSTSRVDQSSSPFKKPLKPRTPAESLVERRLRSPARSMSTPARSTRRNPETPALSTFLKDQSTRIGHIGEEDISLASSTSFRALTPPRNQGGADTTDELECVSALAASKSSPVQPLAVRGTRRNALGPRSPLSPGSPLSPRRAARPIVAGTELRAELARLKNERVVLETRIAALEAEEGRLTALAEAAMRDRARALETAEQVEVAREAAMWEAVVQAADEAIEEERALKAAIAAARAVVLAM